MPEAFAPKKQTPETLTLSITSFNVPTDNNTSFTDSGGFGGGFLKDMQSHAKKIFEISVKRAISLCALTLKNPMLLLCCVSRLFHPMQPNACGLARFRICKEPPSHETNS